MEMKISKCTAIGEPRGILPHINESTLQGSILPVILYDDDVISVHEIERSVAEGRVPT